MTYIWTTSIFHSFPVFCRHVRVFTSISRQNQTLGGDENMLAIQVKVCYILKHLEKIGKCCLFIFIPLGVTSFSFSNCTVEIGSRLVLLYTVWNFEWCHTRVINMNIKLSYINISFPIFQVLNTKFNTALNPALPTVGKEVRSKWFPIHAGGWVGGRMFSTTVPGNNL